MLQWLITYEFAQFTTEAWDEGASFKIILEKPESGPLTSINNSRLNLGENTFLFGFSEPANFTQAFKRWNGVAPSEYQAGL